MSLKEEIYNDITTNEFLSKEEMVNEILSKIEKRIDSMIQVAEQERITREPFPHGRVQALMDVKELLNK